MVRAVLLSFFIMTGCSTQLVPQTPKQTAVVLYSQITTLAFDANDALETGLITPEQHATVYGKLNEARLLVQQGEDVSLLLTEVTELMR